MADIGVLSLLVDVGRHDGGVMRALLVSSRQELDLVGQERHRSTRRGYGPRRKRQWN